MRPFTLTYAYGEVYVCNAQQSLLFEQLGRNISSIDFPHLDIEFEIRDIGEDVVHTAVITQDIGFEKV